MATPMVHWHIWIDPDGNRWETIYPTWQVAFHYMGVAVKVEGTKLSCYQRLPDGVAPTA